MIEILDWWYILNNFDFGIFGILIFLFFGLYVCDLCFETLQFTHSLEIFIELIWTLFFHYEWRKKFVGVIQLLPHTTKTMEMLVIKKKNILPPNANYISLLTIKKSAGKYLWCKEEEVWFQSELTDELPWLTCNKENKVKLVTHETISKLS